MSYNADNDDHPTATIRDAVNELLTRNSYTRGAEVGAIYLGRRILVAHLAHPVTIEGQCTDVSRTVDMGDLIDDFQTAHSSRGPDL